MGDAKSKELFFELNALITKHLRDTYGPPKEGDNLPARVAVATLQISLHYFVKTAAPKKVVKDFMLSLIGEEMPEDQSKLVSPSQSLIQALTRK